ncbi:Cyclin-dependent kinase inhibitor domain [Dillenia turbinata]|uniref:Cyclin-dependent kinase inhibitor domain n=1 Tax=Dillenia turbinata TaxID=194707 RepID=A0AAN8V8N2_9MAGN
MGKYMKKSKTTREIAVMEISSQSPLGVRTRAKTLALQQLQKKNSSPPASPSANSDGYLQLRSRRLEKPPPGSGSEPKKQRREREKDKDRERDRDRDRDRESFQNPKPKQSAKPSNSTSEIEKKATEEDEKAEKTETTEKSVAEEENLEEEKKDENDDLGIEASFGENVLDSEAKDRGNRESTPCSMIRDPDIINSPGSTTRPATSTDNSRRMQMQRHIPTAREMDEFFVGAEEKQQNQFIDKYNFDPVTETPLPGRFKWEKIYP